MTTEDAITELDAAVSGAGAASEFEAQYADAPPEAVDLAARLEAIETRLRQHLTERVTRVERKQAARSAERDTLKADLERQVATLAASVGIATEEERQRLAEARTERKQHDTQGAFFAPGSDTEDTQ